MNKTLAALCIAPPRSNRPNLHGAIPNQPNTKLHLRNRRMQHVQTVNSLELPLFFTFGAG